jgi:phage terminase small subunit
MRDLKMVVLLNARHERFAQAYARRGNASKAYVEAGYEKQGSRQNGFRLLRRKDIAARVHELQTTNTDRVIALEIAKRDARLQVLQQNVDRDPPHHRHPLENDGRRAWGSHRFVSLQL